MRGDDKRHFFGRHREDYGADGLLGVQSPLVQTLAEFGKRAREIVELPLIQNDSHGREIQPVYSRRRDLALQNVPDLGDRQQRSIKLVGRIHENQFVAARPLRPQAAPGTPALTTKAAANAANVHLAARPEQSGL